MSLVMLLAWITPGTDEHSCSPIISMSAPTDTSCLMMTDEEFKAFMVNCVLTFLFIIYSLTIPV